MKRFHVHVAVNDLEANVRFYSKVFGTAPTVQKPDYAKWMLEDPRINFAISNRGATPGVDHIGFQVDSDAELSALRKQMAEAEIGAVDQSNATCCYAHSDKYWITDPQGVAWETYHTLGQAEIFGASTKKTPDAQACCGAKPAAAASDKPAASTCC
jgi:catechol 2,3-dioxygenase-like lactoylglutathione lyase family enzyme